MPSTASRSRSAMARPWASPASPAAARRRRPSPSSACCPSNGRIAAGSVRMYGVDLIPKSDDAPAALPLARDLHRLPGRHERAQPGRPRRRPDRRADDRAPRSSPSSEARKRARELLERVGIPRKRADCVPARAVGRHAPAGDDRHGARLRPGHRHRRRADHRPRRDGPGPGPAAARGAARGARASRSSSSPTTSRSSPRPATG